MHGLFSFNLTPSNPEDYAGLAAIVLLPLVGAIVNGFFGRRLSRPQVHAIGVGVVVAAFALALVAVVQLAFARAASHGDARLVQTLYTWFRLPIAGGEAIDLPVELVIDPLSAVMVLVVTGVGALIHVYSMGYMADDPGYARYFAYLNLFTFSMLLLVTAGNLAVMFVGWEGVGLCSYLLIGFWFTDREKAAAGKKAFIVNRIGDFGFLLGIFLTASTASTVDLARLPTHLGLFRQPWHFGLSVGDAAALLLFVGVCGKSAQIPLYVWLPDAMAGPTPVSALIHAATMVTAGVYMIARTSALYAIAPIAMAAVALVGALTAFFAATIGLAQNDIKKVLAYSTISQLGYMVAGAGVGAFSASIFHLTTHAFFKACLFLGAGSVIHAMGGEQDIRKMGGLGKALPRTHATFLAATLALMGLPPTSGFFSKDEIIVAAFAAGNPVAPWLRYVVWALLLGGVVLTALYMTRLYLLVFAPRAAAAGAAEVSHAEARHPHESPPVMTTPLVVLAVLSLVAGVLGLPIAKYNFFEHWLDPVFEAAHGSLAAPVALGTLGTGGLMLTSVLALGAGALLAYSYYGRGDPDGARSVAERFGPIYRAIRARYAVDEFYAFAVVRPVRFAARVSFELFDRLVIDTLWVNGTAFAVGLTGQIVRKIQNGVVHRYAAFVVVGLAAILWFAFTPAARFRATVSGQTIRVVAEQGPGYEYRWDLDGDRRWDGPYGAERTRDRQTRGPGRYGVRLQIRSPFGESRVESRSVEVRP